MPKSQLALFTTLPVNQKNVRKKKIFRNIKSNSEISIEDLVAFANFEFGGTILLGVDEIENEDGTQKGKNFLLDCLADSPADNHVRQFALLLYGTLAII